VVDATMFFLYIILALTLVCGLLIAIIVLMGKEVGVRIKAFVKKNKGGIIVDIKRHSRSVYRDVIIPDGKTFEIEINKNKPDVYFVNNSDFLMKYGVPEFTYVEGKSNPIKFYGDRCPICREMVEFDKISKNVLVGTDEDGKNIFEPQSFFSCPRCEYETTDLYNPHDDAIMIGNVVLKAKLTSSFLEFVKMLKPILLVFIGIGIGVAISAYMGYQNNQLLMDLKPLCQASVELLKQKGSVVLTS